MVEHQLLVPDSKRTDSWLRQNVIDVAPIWAEFIQIAFANVRIEMNDRLSTTPTSVSLPVVTGKAEPHTEG
jgi:hypothetical protein